MVEIEVVYSPFGSDYKMDMVKIQCILLNFASFVVKKLDLAWSRVTLEYQGDLEYQVDQVG